jgi:TatA/E family protein of Tat protein translocase
MLDPNHLTLAFFQNIGWFEMLLIGGVMLLLFGSRLPEVGKSLGKGIVEFKKGLKSIDDDVQAPSQAQRPYTNQINAGPAPAGPGVQQGVASTVSRADAP